MAISLNGTTGITTPDITSTTSTLGALTQALDLGSTGQVVFPATQNASANANTLDDYEEGTWTGAIEVTGGSVTIGTNGGKYTKTGRVVTISGSFTISSVSSPTGVVWLTGLPFAAGSGATSDTAVALYFGMGVAITGTVISVIRSGESRLFFQLQAPSDDLIYNIASSFNADTVFSINASYTV